MQFVEWLIGVKKKCVTPPRQELADCTLHRRWGGDFVSHPRPSFRAEPMAFGGSNLFRIRSNVHFV